MPEPTTPEEWVTTLTKRLLERRLVIRRYVNYYEGVHNLAFSSARFRKVFGNQISNFADNWTSVVVQAPAERMSVQGVRLGDDDSYDRDAWGIWQRNELDGWSAVHHTSTLTTGYGYALVWADGEDVSITIEDPEQMYVAYEAGTRRRKAALKQWRDEWTGLEFATLYLPDALYKFQTDKPTDELAPEITQHKWIPRKVDEQVLNNPLDEVPVVEFLNDPTIQGKGRSEIRRVIPVQDAINKLNVDMLVSSEYAAYRQRWATGLEIPIDPDTGKPVEAFQAAVDRIWATATPDAKFGEFSETRLSNFVEAIEMLVQHVAAQSRTPRHYFWQAGQSPSGDAIKSAETGLVAKVKERMVHYGERWEEVFRLAFKVLEDPRGKITDAEIRWGDPEYRTEAELTDAIIKQYQTGLITWRKALERLGYTPQEIDRMEGHRTREAMLNQGVDLAGLIDTP